MTRNRFSSYQFKLVALSLGLLVSLMGSVKLYSAEAPGLAKPALNLAKAGALGLYVGDLPVAGALHGAEFMASYALIVAQYDTANGFGADDLAAVPTSVGSFNLIYNTMANLTLMANWASVYMNDAMQDAEDDDIAGIEDAQSALSAMLRDGLRIAQARYLPADGDIKINGDVAVSTIPWLNDVAGGGKGYNLLNLNGNGESARARAIREGDADLAVLLELFGAVNVPARAEEAPKRGGGEEEAGGSLADLITAIQGHDIDGVRAAGGAVREVGDDGNTALHEAVRTAANTADQVDIDILRLLLELGANKAQNNQVAGEGKGGKKLAGFTAAGMIKTTVPNRRKNGITQKDERVLQRVLDLVA